ncbi:MAG: SH3 domain-containing protein [Clostridia bacterium]|nr:SH3 domain-containing protein [Clostridia bacterium]
MKKGRTLIALLLAACIVSACVGALADGFAYWSEDAGSVYFNQASNREYYSSRYEDPMQSTNYLDTKMVRVISKSASIWKEARTNSKRLGTVYNGEEVEIIRGDNGGPLEQSGFYRVSYKGQAGWINKAYCVFSPFEIILMESNVPAYCAPDTRSKKVGSLNKLTRYTVLGTYGDFYVVNLRQASAFIPMSVAHYDTTFENRFLPALEEENGVVINKTTLRTGPGDWYASVEEVKAGYEFTCVGEINGWFVLAYSSKNTDGTVLVYVRDYDVYVEEYYSGANG